MYKFSFPFNAFVLSGILLLGGCASYYSHYAVFPATNSSGEARQVRLSWQTADYPDWWFISDKATAITLETQCSERVWKLTDNGHDGEANRGDCGEGIRACGQYGMDVTNAERGEADDSVVCMAIAPAYPDARIAGLGRTLDLHVYCHPGEVQRVVDDETRNVDYLRASSVPYQIDVRKAPRGSLAARIPTLDDTVCD